MVGPAWPTGSKGGEQRSPPLALPLLRYAPCTEMVAALTAAGQPLQRGSAPEPQSVRQRRVV
jgi:hypothetical protein